MKPPFTMVTDTLSVDTVQCLEELTAQARKGEVLGIAFVALVKQRKFIRNSAGECARNPLFTRGLVAALDDHLRERM